jgi:hypothetical protein
MTQQGVTGLTLTQMFGTPQMRAIILLHLSANGPPVFVTREQADVSTEVNQTYVTMTETAMTISSTMQA